MKIEAHRVKQYNSTTKTVITADGVPVCIVSGKGITTSNVMAYLQGYDVELNDKAVKRALDKALGRR